MIVSSYEPRERIEVFISACDPISRDGIASQLRGHGVELVDERNLHREVVALVVVEEIDEEAARQIRSLKLRGIERLVVIVTKVEDGGLLAAVEAGANGVLKRSQSTGPTFSRPCAPQRLEKACCLRTCWAGCSGRSGGSSARS